MLAALDLAFFALKNANEIGITCAVSKRYKREYQPYWYALHPKRLEFIRTTGEGFFVLGCMDRTEAYALPLAFIEQNLEAFNTTQKGDKMYWHVALTMDNNVIALNLSSIGKKIDLAHFAFKL